MKKFLSLLFVLVLSLSFVACGSTKVKGELVTEIEDVIEYFEDLEYDDISYKFTVKYSCEEKSLEEKAKETYTVKGAFNYETDKMLGHVVESFKYTVTSNDVYTYATVDGKENEKDTYKTSVIFDGNNVYANTKETSKGPDSKSSSTRKTYFDGELFLLGGMTPAGWGYASDASLHSLISLVSGYVDGSSNIFMDEDNLTIVSSDMEEHVVITFKCDGRDIKSLTVEYKSADETMSISVKVCDRVDIERPSSTSGYENINPEGYSPY